MSIFLFVKIDQSRFLCSISISYGSIDLKSEAENERLPKPHALLQQLEEVRESIPQAWYLALLGVANTENSVVYK